MVVWVIEKHIDYAPGEILGVIREEADMEEFMMRLGWTVQDDKSWVHPTNSADSMTISKWGVWP